MRLREAALDHTTENALEAVRELLGMEVAYTTDMTESEQRFRDVQGDSESFGVDEDTVLPVEQTYCKRVLDGRLPNIIPDVRGEDRAADMPITEAADVGAFASVPLRRSDGHLYGTLCAASHEAKPELGYRELQFLHVFARMIADKIERDQLEERSRTLEARLTATAALISAVGARDSYTAEHSHEVVELAEAVGARLGLSEEEAEDLRAVAMLHDIGKIGIPDAILRKPDALDEDEWEEMRRHPIYGEKMIAETPGLAHLKAAVRAEHERWDGGGYPDSLSGDAIPIASRIVLACDAYHAMVSDRPYRKAMPLDAARAELVANAGTQFDPAVVDALVSVLDPD